MLETGTPSSTIWVPNEARSPAEGWNAPGPPPPLAPADIGMERRPNCWTPSRPGGCNVTPGSSSSSPWSDAAVWFRIASLSMTDAVPSSPLARLTGSAVTVMPGRLSALFAIATSAVNAPAGGTTRLRRTGA